MKTAALENSEFNERLIIQARNGDLEAFNQIVDWYQGLIFRVCLRILGNSSKAEDATQDTFIKAYTSLDQYEGGSFKSWLTRIATNRCYDLIRAERRRPAASLEAQPVESEPSWSVEPESEHPDSYAARSQLSEYLERALAALPDEQRVAIVLYDVNGYSYEEIAEIVETSLGTVKSRISRGRSRLREILQSDERAWELFGSFRRQRDDETTQARGRR
jgi:RNA polymerase sigma-70 factor, ECF subfamily